jgi:hypothetical protein
MKRLLGRARRGFSWLALALVGATSGCGGRAHEGDVAVGGGATGEGASGGGAAAGRRAFVPAGGEAAASGAGGTSGLGPFAGPFADAGSAATTGGFGGTPSGTGGENALAGTAGVGGALPPTACGVYNQAPAPTTLTAHVVEVPGLDAAYLPGGAQYKRSGVYDFGHRPYAVAAPSSYYPDRKYSVHISSPECGELAEQFVQAPPRPFVYDPKHASIEVVLSYIDGCVSDGGPRIGNRNDTPDLPYLRAVLADLDATWCADVSHVTITGYASGAWEAQTLACAASDVIRGVATIGGGLREMRPPCLAPQAAFFVAHTDDTASPLGPLTPDDPAYVRVGGAGLAPSRDELLARNGCQGTGTAPWDPNYPACVTYTACPAAYPVVWCDIGPMSQSPYSFNGVAYFTSDVWRFFSSLP